MLIAGPLVAIVSVIAAFVTTNAAGVPLRDAFTPTDDEVAEARATLDVLEQAAAAGMGAVAAGDRMLDEALAVSARRVLERAGP